jgi:hypothetical protein
MAAQVLASNSFIISTGIGALPEKHALMELISAFSIPGWLKILLNMVVTIGAKVGLCFVIALMRLSAWGFATIIFSQPIRIEKFMHTVRRIHERREAHPA